MIKFKPVSWTVVNKTRIEASEFGLVASVRGDLSDPRTESRLGGGMIRVLTLLACLSPGAIILGYAFLYYR